MTIDGVGLVMGFLEHLQNVTTSNYTAIANSETLQFTTARTKCSQSAVFTRLGRIPTMSSASVLTFLPNGDCLITTSYSSNITVSRLYRNHSCSSLYTLGTDSIRNTSPNSSVVASCSYCTDRVENTDSQLLLRCFLQVCCLVTGVNTYISLLIQLEYESTYVSLFTRLRCKNTLLTYLRS
jgi:hypothetical protein